MNLNASREEVGEIQKSDRHGLISLSNLTSLGLSFHRSENGVQRDDVQTPSHPRIEGTTQRHSYLELFLALVRSSTLSSKTCLPHLYLLPVESQGPGTEAPVPVSHQVSGHEGIKGSRHWGLRASPQRARQTSDCQASCAWARVGARGGERV